MAEERSVARNEKVRLLGLILVLLVCIAALISLHPGASNPPPKRGARPDKIILQDLKPDKSIQIEPQPFQPDPKILASIIDDRYLHTAGFYYLIHLMMTSPAAEIRKKIDPSLSWQHLIKKESRNRIRGRIIRLRGGLVDLQRRSLDGEEARKRGIAGGQYWQGMIYTVQGRRYLFAVTDFPQGFAIDDEVELAAAFFKVWIYENLHGKETYSPYFIGKQLRRIVPAEPKGANQLALLFFIILVVTVIVLVLALLKESKDAARFWHNYRERRLVRLRKRASAGKPGPAATARPTNDLEGGVTDE